MYRQVKVGSMSRELKQVASDELKFEVLPPFMVDLYGVGVSKEDVIQYRILSLPKPGGATAADSIMQDSDSIKILMTDNPNYQTSEGLKVGMSIKEAEAIYGKAKLSYNINNESREYVTFANLTDSNLSFRTNQRENFAGIYPDLAVEYHQTDKYRPDAAIATIEVSCVPGCSDDFIP